MMRQSCLDRQLGSLLMFLSFRKIPFLPKLSVDEGRTHPLCLQEKSPSQWGNQPVAPTISVSETGPKLVTYMSVLTSVTLSGTTTKKKKRRKKAIREVNLHVQGRVWVLLHGGFSCQAPPWWALSKPASCSLLCPEQWLILSLVIGQINLRCSSAAFHTYTEDEYVPHSQTMRIYKMHAATRYITWYRATFSIQR